MLRTAGAVVIVSTLLIAGCAATPETAPTPKPKPNATSCEDFAAATDNMLDDIKLDADWEALRNKFDTISLKAKGDVKERISTLVDNWPDLFNLAVMGNIDDFNASLKAVERACAAEGVDVTVNQFVTG